MMGLTGIEIDFLYIMELANEMKAVTDDDCQSLVKQLYEEYEVVEPGRAEVERTARTALALERLVERRNIDALAIDFSGGMVPLIGAMPRVGMARLTDKGIGVATAGDPAVSVESLTSRVSS